MCANRLSDVFVCLPSIEDSFRIVNIFELKILKSFTFDKLHSLYMIKKAYFCKLYFFSFKIVFF